MALPSCTWATSDDFDLELDGDLADALEHYAQRAEISLNEAASRLVRVALVPDSVAQLPGLHS